MAPEEAKDVWCRFGGRLGACRGLRESMVLKGWMQEVLGHEVL